MNIIEGVYIAQPLDDGTKGIIYTCSNGFAAPSVAQLNLDTGTGCKRAPLTVYGALIAREIKFYRSSGAISTGTPAETINVTPATWLATPCAVSKSCGVYKQEIYNAASSLPPVL